MQQNILYQRLKALELQKAQIEAEIKAVKQQLSQKSALSQKNKIVL